MPQEGKYGRVAPPKIKIPTPEERAKAVASIQEYNSLFHGNIASRNTIIAGNPGLEITLNHLIKHDSLIGQHEFIPMEEGVEYDVKLWLASERPQGLRPDYETPQTETVPGMQESYPDPSPRTTPQPIPDQLRLAHVRSLLAREVLIQNGGITL